MGIAVTGKQVRGAGIMIDRIADGKFAEEWEEWDTLGMMQQLGAVAWTAKAEKTVAG
jgi:predicted ester cyclase